MEPEYTNKKESCVRLSQPFSPSFFYWLQRLDFGSHIYGKKMQHTVVTNNTLSYILPKKKKNFANGSLKNAMNESKKERLSQRNEFP
jgi:hypothetical protein